VRSVTASSGSSFVASRSEKKRPRRSEIPAWRDVHVDHLAVLVERGEVLHPPVQADVIHLDAPFT